MQLRGQTLVGAAGFQPAIFRSQAERISRLSQAPKTQAAPKDLSLGAAFYRHRVFKVSIDEGRPLWVITRDPVPRLLRGLCAFVMDACSHLL